MHVFELNLVSPVSIYICMLPLNKVVGCRLQPRAGSVPLNPILSEPLFLRYFVDCVCDQFVCQQALAIMNALQLR